LQVLLSRVGSWPYPQTLDWVLVLARDKHSSLLRKSVITYGRKKFYSIATWWNVVQDVDGFPVGLGSFELGNEPGQLAVHVHAVVQGPARVEHGEVVTVCREY
jgi:hypothetical protein